MLANIRARRLTGALPRGWCRGLCAALSLCTAVAAANGDEPAEAPDRWSVQNRDYNAKWGVESADMGARWQVETGRFDDALGERATDRVPIVHRGVTMDTAELPVVDAPVVPAAEPAAKKESSNTGAASPGGKAPAGPAVVERPASAAPSGKKGSYKKYSIDVAGVPREYYVYLPAGYKPGVKYPAVIAFHGFKSDANGLRWLIKPDKWANKFQYIIVYPNAVDKSWNVGKGSGSTNKSTDDLAFSKALYKAVLAGHPVDPQRIYAMGFSNGAQMAALWVCHMADRIAAAAMVAHTMNIAGCKPSHRTPIALVHGMQDRIAPYKGGGKHGLASHLESVDFFKNVVGTTGKKVHLQSSKSYKCESWRRGDKLSEVIDCKMYNDGHSWPGGVEFMVDVLGTTNKDFNATEFLFRMFAKYRKLPAPR